MTGCVARTGSPSCGESRIEIEQIAPGARSLSAQAESKPISVVPEIDDSLGIRRKPGTCYLRCGAKKMTKDEILATLKSVEPQLRARGVSHAALFGSVARGEARPDSDIDIMVEIDPAAGLGVFEYVGIMNFLGDMFPSKVDVSNRKAMRDYVRPSAERDAVYAF